MTKIIFATTNKGKLREFQEILPEGKYSFFTMEDIGFTEEIEEDGTTFLENAAIKAKAVAKFAAGSETFREAIVLADDSGLEIDYYDKKPGVMSHRWLGERTYPQAMQDVMDDMKDVPEEKRGARFVCAMAAVLPGGEVLSVQESVEGRVGYEMKGENGFGYDPFFYVPEYGCTTAEMTPSQKNEISHRGKALRSMCRKLEEQVK
ncbi:MAG: RdgB/HAM1 family non-canonical purine NTP pyrophosphatase [Lachnospiraceae bacterium]|nr:RdgB/HAM1 family non-canonical purine NTP pyrophosphatase [Lachnospiraceae bacterium]